MAKILGAHIPLEPKNLAINGNFDYWQRVETATTTINTATGTSGYTADMFLYESNGGTTKNYSVVQSSTVPTQAQSGFDSQLSYLFTMVTGIASPVAADYVSPAVYRMEGYDYAAIHSRTVTFGFWIQGSIAGTYSFALQNAASTRSYVTTFSIASANTWQFIPITVALDTTGTWVFTNTVALQVFIGTVSGTTYQTSTVGSWQAGNFLTASGATNWQSTTGATLYISQFSIVEGSLGLGSLGFVRAGKSSQQELALCQRYYEKSYDVGTAVGTATALGVFQCGDIGATSGTHTFAVPFKVSKRATGATVNLYAFTTGTVNEVNGTASSGTTITFGPSSAAAAGSTNVGVNGFTGSANSYSASSAGMIIGHWTADAGL